MNIDEQYEDNLLQILATTVKTIGSIVSTNTEIVLHDLRQPAYSIVEIANAHVSGRKKGDSVLAGLRTDKAFIAAMEMNSEPVTLLLDYETYSGDGSPLRSSSAIYRRKNAQPFAALCINVDAQNIQNALDILQRLTATTPTTVEETILDESHYAPNNIEDLMSEIINSVKKLSRGNRRADNKNAKLYAVKQMQNKGIFLMKGGVEKAASALGVTRYTIYNYLDELKKNQ